MPPFQKHSAVSIVVLLCGLLGCTSTAPGMDAASRKLYGENLQSVLTWQHGSSSHNISKKDMMNLLSRGNNKARGKPGGAAERIFRMKDNWTPNHGQAAVNHTAPTLIHHVSKCNGVIYAMYHQDHIASRDLCGPDNSHCSPSLL